MKPDEHKKKKSAQYRKKHGDSTTQIQKNTIKNKGSGRGEKIKEKTTKEPVRKTTNTSLKNDSDSSDQEDNANEPQFEEKTFQRRQIVSNWDRYELPNEDKSSDETKGTDVSELLKLSGSASYHFSLKDEKVWDSIMKESTPGEYLSIDLENLSAALSCIPMYKRLRIDKSLFSESQIEAMNNEAIESEKKYKPVSKKLLSTRNPIVSEDCDVNNLLQNLDLCDDDLPNICSKENCGVSVSNQSNSGSRTFTSVQNQGEEKDLLFLLENSCEAENSDDMNLQNEGTASKNVVKTEPSNSNAVNTEAAPGVEDLENWLDSVLEN